MGLADSFSGSGGQQGPAALSPIKAKSDESMKLKVEDGAALLLKAVHAHDVAGIAAAHRLMAEACRDEAAGNDPIDDTA